MFLTRHLLAGIPLLLLMGIPACQAPGKQLAQLQQTFDLHWQRALPPGPAGLPLPEATAVDKAWQLCLDTGKQLEAFEPDRLPSEARTAYLRLRSTLEDRRAYLLRLRNDPGSYNLGDHLKSALASDQPGTTERWRAVDSLLQRSDQFYDQAKKILENPEYEPTLTAIAQQQLTLSLLENELPDTLNLSPLDEINKNSLRTGLVKARFAVKDYLAFCRSLAFEYQDSIIRQQ